MRFKIGQQIVCVKPGNGVWHGVTIDGKIVSAIGPKYNEIVTCSGYGIRDNSLITLFEYPDPPYLGYDNPAAFVIHWFEPLLDITEIKSILQQEPQSV